jgi:hypothetical protein
MEARAHWASFLFPQRHVPSSDLLLSWSKGWKERGALRMESVLIFHVVGSHGVRMTGLTLKDSLRWSSENTQFRSRMNTGWSKEKVLQLDNGYGCIIL